MRVVLVRHGEKAHGVPPESTWPLQNRGDAGPLRRFLDNTGCTPTVILSSPWKHSSDTAEVLANRPNSSRTIAVNALSSLEPRRDVVASVGEVLDDAARAGVEIGPGDIVAVVGHEPHLSELLVSMTGRRSRPFERLEAVIVDAESVPALRAGLGVLRTRLPVRDFQEKELREKVRSKLIVTTFLAGFTLNAIVTLLRAAPPPGNVSIGGQLNIANYSVWTAAVSTLFVALVLFVSAVYVYDRLAMPEGFWTSEERPKFSRYWPQSFRDDFNRHGPLYAYMVRTWKFVFTPAVMFTLVGYFLLLALNAAWSVVFLSAIAVVLGCYYYNRARPRLGVD
jgi:phosphohistidine phosphatase SixA